MTQHVDAETTGATPGASIRSATEGPGQSMFLRACRGESTAYTPVWFMRQAGRSLPEYHRVRADLGMLESCRRPELVAEITLQPVRRYGVDAAIFYSDIMVPLAAIDVGVDIRSGVGPVIEHPIRQRRDLDRVRRLEPGDVDYVDQAVRILVGELGSTPLVGFAGGPFTLASYLVEGGPSRDYAATKALMYGQPEVWHALVGRLAEVAAAFLRVQVEAGASAVQVFDSWAGALSPQDYRTYVAPHTRALLSEVGAFGVPRIHFGVGTAELLPAMAEVGADVMGVDWRVGLDEAARRIGSAYAVQGNLDPTLVFAPWELLAERSRAVLDAGRAARGHVFNLGHGVLPSTDPDVLARLVDFVHTASSRASDV